MERHKISHPEKIYFSFLPNLRLLLSVITFICLFGIMGAISFHQMRAHESLNEVLQQIGSTQAEFSVRKRSFTARERELLVSASQTYFETKEFEVVISAESNKDFRVKTATLVAVSSNFPVDARLGVENSNLNENEVWIDYALAKQLGINIGDEISIAGETLIYAQELIRPPNFQDNFPDQQILLLDKADRTAKFDARYSTHSHFIYMNLDDGKDVSQLSDVVDKLNEDVYLTANSDQSSPHISEFKIWASLANIELFGLMFISFLVLMSHFLYWNKDEDCPDENLLYLPAGLSVFCVGVVGAGILWAMELLNQAAVVSTFFVPMTIFLSLAVIAYLNSASTETFRQRTLVWITQFATLGLILATLISANHSVQMSLLLVGLIFAILMAGELATYFAPETSLPKWGNLLLSLFCVLCMVGLTLGGLKSMKDMRTPKVQLLVSNVFSNQVPDVLNTLSGLKTGEFGSILAQMTAINGREFNFQATDFEADSLKAIIADRRLTHQTLLKGKWWTPFDAQLSVAISQRFAQSFNIEVNDNLTFFVQGQQAVVKVRAIFDYSMHHTGFSPNILVSENIQDIVTVNTNAILVEDGAIALTRVDDIAQIVPDATIQSNTGAVIIKTKLSKQADENNRGLEATIGIAFVGFACVISILALLLVRATSLKRFTLIGGLFVALAGLVSMSFFTVTTAVNSVGWRLGIEAEEMSGNVWKGMLVYGVIVGLLFVIMYKLSAIKTSDRTS